MLEHFVDFTVDLGSGARKTIIDEVEWVQRDIGEVETGGWLIAQQRPRASSKSITIAYATGPLPGSRASRTSVELGDPIEAAVAVREAGIGEPWTVIGDWHAHTFRGSDLPSLQDAKAWARHDGQPRPRGIRELDHLAFRGDGLDEPEVLGLGCR